jgi:chromosome segregation ATPase
MKIFLASMRIYSLFLGAFLFVSAGCGSLDIAFINEVKTFEPRWMDMSEKVSFVERNLTAAENRYARDLEEIEAAAEKKAELTADYYSLKSQYQEMLSRRDLIRNRFEVQKEQFTGAAYAFNAWQVKLMKKKIDEEQAREDLEQFKAQYSEILLEIDKIQGEVITNVQEHNAILRKLTQLLGVYTTYDMDPR